MALPPVGELSCGRSFDVKDVIPLPPAWDRQIVGIARRVAITTILTGRASSSIQKWNTEELEVRVVTGDLIRQELSWLYDLYLGPFRELAEEVAGRRVKCASAEVSAININILSGPGGGYEWHVDTNPVTGLLFVTGHGAEDGGELVFGDPDRPEVIRPRAGSLMIFSARERPHAVLPLKRAVERISVPMNYYFEDEPEMRPADLDDYLYGSFRSLEGE